MNKNTGHQVAYILKGENVAYIKQILFFLARVYGYIFVNSRGGKSPLCSAAWGLHLHHGKSTAKQPVAFSCHCCCLGPQGDRSLCPWSWKQTKTAQTPCHPVCTEERQDQALHLGPNLDEDTKQWWWLWGWGWGVLLRDPHPVCVTAGGNNHNKIYISWAIWHMRASWGLLSIVRHNNTFLPVVTSPDKDRKHCPVHHNQKVELAGCTCTGQPIVMAWMMFVLWRETNVASEAKCWHL